MVQIKAYARKNEIRFTGVKNMEKVQSIPPHFLVCENYALRKT